MTLDVDVELVLGKFRLTAEFRAAADGITVLFGPSGSGKSSLLSVLAGLKRPKNCRITLGGRSVEGLAPHLRGIGLVFQDAKLFPHLTVRQNIVYASKRAPAGSRLSIEEVAGFFDIATQLNRPVAHLSGGEKSRAALARAVASAPDFLLLDEPFAALDGTRRRAFVEVLLEMHHVYRLPMIVVTHDIDDAAGLASYLVALKDGSVVAAGPFEEASRAPQFQSLLDARDMGAAVKTSSLRSLSSGRQVWVRADQLLLAAEEPRAVSARNVMAGEVGKITAEADGSLIVELLTQSGPLLSRITQEAANDLDLAPGKRAWALVKAHAL
jgi:molybdate transport system ATP-binding protein